MRVLVKFNEAKKVLELNQIWYWNQIESVGFKGTTIRLKQIDNLAQLKSFTTFSCKTFSL